jgi:hypothetical protein
LSKTCAYFSVDDAGVCQQAPSESECVEEANWVDAGNTDGIFMLFCSINESSDSTCSAEPLPGSAISSAVEDRTLTNCYERCLEDGHDCSYFAYHEHTQLCEMFPECHHFKHAPPNAQSMVYMMHDEAWGKSAASIGQRRLNGVEHYSPTSEGEAAVENTGADAHRPVSALEVPADAQPMLDVQDMAGKDVSPVEDADSLLAGLRAHVHKTEHTSAHTRPVSVLEVPTDAQPKIDVQDVEVEGTVDPYLALTDASEAEEDAAAAPAAFGDGGAETAAPVKVEAVEAVAVAAVAENAPTKNTLPPTDKTAGDLAAVLGAEEESVLCTVPLGALELLDQLQTYTSEAGRAASDVHIAKRTVFACGFLLALLLTVLVMYGLSNEDHVQDVMMGAVAMLFLCLMTVWVVSGINGGYFHPRDTSDDAAHENAANFRFLFWAAAILGMMLIVVVFYFLAPYQLDGVIRVLSSASGTLKRLPSIALFSLVPVFCSLLLIIYWITVSVLLASCETTFIITEADGTSYTDTSPDYYVDGLGLLLLVGMLWGVEFFKAVGSCATAGTVYQ